MKKAKKKFYQILPLLIVPGLIMSAILPFVLPALKMMTLLAGMINNMAFTGAVFTLLRNNAFNDKYEHKVIYVNEGYENEKHAHIHDDHYGDFENYEESKDEFEIVEDNGQHIEEQPLNSDWLKQHYGSTSVQGNVFPISGSHYKRSSKIRST